MAKPVARSESSPPAAPPVRFGLTVGKKMARRSVDRVLVKRVLREAVRHGAAEVVTASQTGFDVVLRLKAPLPARESITRTALKRALRADADMLLRRFRDQVSQAAAAQ